MNRISDEKIKAIANEYLTNGMVKTKALQAVGYTKNYSEHGGLKLFDNDRLKNEIACQQAEIERKSSINITELQTKTMERYEACVQKGQESNALRALDMLIKMQGGYTQDRPNPEQTKITAEARARAALLRADFEEMINRKYNTVTIESQTITETDQNSGHEGVSPPNTP